jgi:hypothetical protein
METSATTKAPGRNEIQSSFLSSIKRQLPRHISLSDEIAELLHISRDSAYRRIRRETVLTLDEVRILCQRYNVSIDSLLEQGSDRVSFDLEACYGPGYPLQSWLESIRECLQTIKAQPDGHIVWHSKEIPLFHYFPFHRLSAFKFYWWMNMTGDNPSNEKFNANNISRDLITLGERTSYLYSQLSSTEIISRDMINTTLRQIEYALESGSLEKSTALELCADCSAMVTDIERQARQGHKGDADDLNGGKLELFVNELMTGDNTMLFQSRDKQTAFVTHSNFNVMSTSNDAFCRQTEHHMKAMIRRGIMISRVAERERIKFFNSIRQQIEVTVATLKAGS